MAGGLRYLCHHAMDDLRRDLARVLRRFHQLVLGFLQKIVRTVTRPTTHSISKWNLASKLWNLQDDL